MDAALEASTMRKVYMRLLPFALLSYILAYIDRINVSFAALTMRDIDSDGLDEMDKRILEALVHKFAGGPVGLNSLAVAIGYPDLVASINVTINQTGQAIENVLLIMAAYLTVSLSISAFMNWYNKRIALRER